VFPGQQRHALHPAERHGKIARMFLRVACSKRSARGR
jgi:hypothetical protein